MQRRKGTNESTTSPQVLKQMERYKVDDKDPLAGAMVCGMSGQYSIVGRVGEGGMGQIYLGFDGQGNKVAVKFISDDNDKRGEKDRDKLIARFYKEANAAALIDHPNIIKIFDVGTYRNKVFQVLEFLDGEDLEHVLKKQGRLSWEFLAPIMMEMCDGMYAAHSHSSPILHRDLSLDNLFLANIDGRRVVKVLDFGCVKFLEEGEDDGLTRDGDALGKWKYMAPEQVEKAKGRRNDYDHRVDIYTMGVMMYIGLTGVPPFKAKTMLETLEMRLDKAPKMPSEINPHIMPEVEAMVMKAMARYEDDRYPDALALKEAIRRSMEGRLGIISGVEPLKASLESSGPLMGEGSGRSRVISEPVSALRNIEGKKSGGFGRFVKRVVVLGMLAGLGYGAYEYRGQIAAYWNKVAGTYFQKTQVQRQKPVPAPSASAPQEQFTLTLSTQPERADVYLLINGRIGSLIGTTPFQKSLPLGEHTLLIVRRGYRQETVTVSSASPSPPPVRLTSGGRTKRQRSGAAAGQQSVETEPETIAPPETPAEVTPTEEPQ